MADAVAVGELEDVMRDKPEGLPNVNIESTSRDAALSERGRLEREGYCPAAVRGTNQQPRSSLGSRYRASSGAD